MKLIYIAGPYRGETDDDVYENIQRARRYAKKYWRLGYAVFCPHLNTSFFSGVIDEQQFMLAGLKFLTMCDVLMLPPRWEISDGCVKEHRLARETNKEIIYDKEDL